MEFDAEAMCVFAALARAGGVRGAGRALGMPRSTVSRKLAELEAAVAMPLVVRTARRFELTSLGRQLAEQSEQLEAVLRRSQELVRLASAEPTGTLRVAVAPVLGEEILAGMVADLSAKYPRLVIDASLSVDYSDLRRSAIDVALRASPLDDASDVFVQKLGTSAAGCYVSPAYATAHGTPKTPAELADHACIMTGPARWKFARGVAVEVSGRIRVDNFRVAREVAARGAGVLRTAAVFAEPLVARGELVPVLERWWPSIPIYAVHARANPSPPHVRVFVAAAREAVARVLPADRKPPRW
ncbi:MAG: LysR family transcriptional regulator, partial [Kofleriaceae bacterium]